MKKNSQVPALKVTGSEYLGVPVDWVVNESNPPRAEFGKAQFSRDHPVTVMYNTI